MIPPHHRSAFLNTLRSLPWQQFRSLGFVALRSLMIALLTLAETGIDGTQWVWDRIRLGASSHLASSASANNDSIAQATLRRQAMLKLGKRILAPLVGIIVLLGIWQILCNSPDAPLPSPARVIQDTWDPLIKDPFFAGEGTDKGLFWQIAASLWRVAQGYGLAAVIGIGLGILIGSNLFVSQAVDPIFQVLRTVPPLAWLPIALAGFKDSAPSAIFVIFITAIWPILINTTVGVQQIPQDYRNVARVIRLSGFMYFLKILLPAALPYIFTGLRIGVGLSWLAIVASEMLIGGVGIGFFIWDAYNSSRISEIILALVYVGMVGFLLDKLVAFVGTLVVAEDPA